MPCLSSAPFLAQRVRDRLLPRLGDVEHPVVDHHEEDAGDERGDGGHVRRRPVRGLHVQRRP